MRKVSESIGLWAGSLAFILASCTRVASEPVADREDPNVQPKPEPPRFKPILEGLPPQTIVLTYHDVVESRGPGSVWFDATEEEFRDQIDWLEARGANFVDLRRLYAHLTQNEPLPKNPVVLTFADNYLGFYERAYPLLKARGIPSAMFVHTGYIGSKVGRPKMDWARLKKLDREGLVTIASQTVSHPGDLTKLTREQLADEMARSKQTLEQGLGRDIHFVAYPNGKFNQPAMDAARRAGYLMAFTEEQKPSEQSPSILAVARYVHTKYREAWSDVPR